MAGQDLGDRFVIELLSTGGRPASAEIHIRPATVEVWYQDQRQASMNRDLFRNWLDNHPRPYVIENIMWAETHGGTLGLVIRNCGFWLIAPHLLTGLRARV